MLKKLILLGTIPLAMSLTSCAGSTTGTVRTVSDFCLIAKGITYSEIKPTQLENAGNQYDTPETVVQVKAHDLAYERVCKPKPTN